MGNILCGVYQIRRIIADLTNLFIHLVKINRIIRKRIK